jgi:hypothetical protein
LFAWFSGSRSTISILVYLMINRFLFGGNSHGIVSDL